MDLPLKDPRVIPCWASGIEDVSGLLRGYVKAFRSLGEWWPHDAT